MGAQRTEAVRFDVTSRDGTPQGTIAPASPGSITCTQGRRVWRSVELSPADWQQLDPYDTLITASYTVDGITSPVGVFAPVSGTAAYTPGNQQPADTSVTTSATVDLMDQTVFLDIQLADPAALPVGDSPTPVIEALLEAAGFSAHDIQFLPATASEPAVYDGTALDAIDSMCEAAGAYPLWFTADGIPTVRLIPSPADMTATRTYAPGDGLVVGTPEFPFDLFAPNRWEAQGGTDDAPQTGVYDLPAGVTGWQGQRGFRIINRFQARAVTDVTTLEAVARGQAVVDFRNANGLAFDTVTAPDHEPWEVIAWGADGSLYLEDSFTIPMSAGSVMQHRAGAVLVP